MGRFVALLMVLLLAVGCSKGVSVQGKVVFEDGAPLTTGEVRLVGGSKTFSGTIQKDGTFVMQGATPGSGIEPGTYKVAIVGAFEVVGGSGADDDYGTTRPLIALKYSDPENSGLTHTVKGNETVEFKVTSP